MSKATHYEVRFTNTVDASERRNSTYPVVKAGTDLHMKYNFVSQNGAVAFFNSILEGEWDFGSEFVSKITVLAMYDFRSPRVVRRTVVRTR